MNNPFYGAMFGYDLLVAQNMTEGHYFSNLPEEVQEAINQRADEFHSSEEIHAFAEEMMKRS